MCPKLNIADIDFRITRRFQYLQQDDPVPNLIEKHMLAMGFQYSRDYSDWCWANGFDGTFEMSRADLRKECDAFEAAKTKRKKHN